ncbi:hypothetical protein NC653_025959 [Populus alba x Populus x berolinensis]|uniref:Uncharacterized protein n=1 Tax=Populus alba x Populus x berolinensis TaxID=444605 RepID=A0AAD6MEU2_9ROSI|nr:hypothetical protein NC653_025959 [Populus alba x Populus x berolinensis]
MWFSFADKKLRKERRRRRRRRRRGSGKRVGWGLGRFVLASVCFPLPLALSLCGVIYVMGFVYEKGEYGACVVFYYFVYGIRKGKALTL